MPIYLTESSRKDEKGADKGLPKMAQERRTEMHGIRLRRELPVIANEYKRQISVAVLLRPASRGAGKEKW